jgi:hypothetical protein
VLLLFTKDQLQGILLSLARPELAIFQNSKKPTGYEIRVRVVIRGDISFLNYINRTLHQYQIESTIKLQESKVRPLPVLRISRIDTLFELCKLVPNLPDAKDKWVSFKKVINIMFIGEHRSQDGLDLILELKGEI